MLTQAGAGIVEDAPCRGWVVANGAIFSDHDSIFMAVSRPRDFPGLGLGLASHCGIEGPCDGQALDGLRWAWFTQNVRAGRVGLDFGPYWI
jgi:hypothetical protein